MAFPWDMAQLQPRPQRQQRPEQAVGSDDRLGASLRRRSDDNVALGAAAQPYDAEMEFYFGKEEYERRRARSSGGARKSAGCEQRQPERERAVASQHPQPRQSQPEQPRRPKKDAPKQPRRRPASARAAAGAVELYSALSARRVRSMIPEELRAASRQHGLPTTGSASEMRGRLMKLLPARPASAAETKGNPGYRPSRQHLAAADDAHARGGRAASAASLRLSRGVKVAQLALQDVRSGASTTLDWLRDGRIAVLLFWATGIGGGTDPKADKWSGSAVPHDP